jgi:UDP-2,3-diacylglucosamine pyrophosphatase LpxH
LRTLIISDLHLGGRLEHDVLRRREPLAALLSALDDVDRLVLLGDIVELLEGRATQAMAVAEPVLRAIGRRLGAHRQVVVVPGNHDRILVRAWTRAVGPALAPETDVPADATAALSRIVSWLAPARVTVKYPGVWLADGLYATHGHYLDWHLFPVSAFGVARGLLRRPPQDVASPNDYEHARRPSFARFSRWLPRPALALLDDAAELARAATMPTVHRRLLAPRFAPVTARLLGVQMQRASVPALARVIHRMRLDADWVVFGHVHRLGPLGADDPVQWQGPGGRPRILNTGSWVYEPLLVHRASGPHPYWPGGAIRLGDDGWEPRAVGLLDGLSVEVLH